MKKIIIITCFSLIKLSSFAQIQGSAIYKYTSGGLNGKITFFKLYFDANKSLYVGNKGSQAIRLQKLTPPLSFDDTLGIDEKEFQEAAMNKRKIYTYFIDEEGDCVYKNFKDSILIFRHVLTNAPLITVEPKLPVLNWNILEETKRIGKFNCQKATTSFRGRKYEVWYTLEIPISNGPWKLHGLPGLILEAQTDDSLFSYVLESVDLSEKNINLIKEPKLGERCLLNDYQKVRDKITQDALSKAITEVESKGASVYMSFDPKKVKRSNANAQELNFDDMKN